MCKNEKVELEMFHDYYMNEPGTILSGSNTVYQKFTPYYEKSIIDGEFKSPSKSTVKNLTKTTKTFDKTITLNSAMDKYVGEQNEDLVVRGGRTLGLSQLRKALISTKNYKDDRDDMSKETSILSEIQKYEVIMYFHKIKAEYRNEKLLIFTTLLYLDTFVSK